MPMLKSYEFTIFIEEVEGAHVAHALEAGMLATDDSLEAALSKLSIMLIRHIEFAEKNDRPDQIYRPAPPEVWKRFSELRGRDEVRPFEERNRFISFDNLPKVRLNQMAYAAPC
jgi:hypothetical protein